MDGQPYAWQSEGQGFESPRVHQIFEYRIDLWSHRVPRQQDFCSLFCSLSAAYFLPIVAAVLPRAGQFAMLGGR